MWLPLRNSAQSLAEKLFAILWMKETYLEFRFAIVHVDTQILERHAIA